MKMIPLRDVTDLDPAEVVRRAVYGTRRRVGLAPEHQVAKGLRSEVDSTAPDGEGPEVLFFTPRDWGSHVQWESLIAQALRLRGASVSVLGCGGGLEICDHNNCHRAPPMPCGSCTRYTSDASAAHGLPRDALSYSGTPPEWPELDELSVDELYEVEWDGVPLGRLAVVPTQWFNMSTRVDDDPLAPTTIRHFLRAGRQVAAALRRHLDAHPPDTVVMLNGLFFFESICWELCRQRGIDVVTYEQGFVPGSLVFRRNATACHYDHSAWWEDWSTRSLTDEEERRLTDFTVARRTGGQTQDAYWKEVSFDDVHRTRKGTLAVMFTNLTWDSAVIGKQLAFASIHDWIAAAIEHFASRPEDELMVRIHPAERKLRGKTTREPVGELIRERFPVLPDNVRIIPPEDTTSSYTLMEEADVGLVYTSTTGLELAMGETPVIVAGNPHYRGKGFTVDVTDPADFARQVDRLMDDPQTFRPDVDLARRYAFLFLFAAPITFPFLVEPSPGRPRLEVRHLAELAPGRNVDLDRLCDGLLGRGDFGPEA